MAILRIARMGHPVLRAAARPVADPAAPEVARLAADMRETLEHIGASGLAAPQVFAPLRLVVYRLRADRIPSGSGLAPVPWTVMANPELAPRAGGTADAWERCLSLPGLHGLVPRHRRVGVRYTTLAGEAAEFEAEGSHAALLQHECDHLDGVLYPMRMTDLSLLAFNDSPGALAARAEEAPETVDPLFLDLAARWPDRERWLRPAPPP